MSTQRLKWIVIGVWGVAIVCLIGLFASGAFAALLTPNQVPAFIAIGNPVVPTALPASPTSVNPGSDSIPPQTTPGPATELPSPYPTLTPFVLPTLKVTLPYTDVGGGIDPLTGLPVDDPTLLERRPIAVKIVNYPRHTARPVQSGLSIADVVYEYTIEFGMTRYLGIFYGKDSARAGAIRSGRFIDEHLMRMYHAVLAYANMDDRVQDYFLHSDLLPYLMPPRDDNCPPICRDTKITGYNNVFIDTRAVSAWLKYAGVDNDRQNLRSGFFSSVTMPWLGQEAQRIFVRYSGYAYAYWEYDAALGQYLRYQDTDDALGGAPERYAPLYDAVTGEQVAFDNMVVLLVKHSYYNRDDQVMEIHLVNEGPAFVFREGRVYEARWVRDQIDQPLFITDPAENPLALKPGRTFFQVLSDQTTYVQDGTDWRFRFALP